jgi:hypothetical protein
LTGPQPADPFPGEGDDDAGNAPAAAGPTARAPTATEPRILDDPVVAAQLASLFGRGLTRHRSRQTAGIPEPPEVARERQEIIEALARRRAQRAVNGDRPPQGT